MLQNMRKPKSVRVSRALGRHACEYLTALLALRRKPCKSAKEWRPVPRVSTQHCCILILSLIVGDVCLVVVIRGEAPEAAAG